MLPAFSRWGRELQMRRYRFQCIGVTGPNRSGPAQLASQARAPSRGAYPRLQHFPSWHTTSLHTPASLRASLQVWRVLWKRWRGPLRSAASRLRHDLPRGCRVMVGGAGIEPATPRV
jgi:hypothetical protein